MLVVAGSGSIKIERQERGGTYVEEIPKDDIRLILRELNNSLRECLIHENGLPSSDSYCSVSLSQHFNLIE